MKLDKTIVAAVVMMAPRASSAAVPADYLSAIALRDNGSALPKLNSDIANSLSYLFGWQMAGAAASQDEIAAACADISSIGHGKWAAMGLNTEYIQEPLCISSDANPHPNPKNSITQIIHYTSEIFITQILGAFDDNALQYMCNQVDFFLLDSFLLNDTQILSGICHSVGDSLPPRPFGPNHPDSGGQDAAMIAKNSASALYAFLLASGATTDTELNVLCAHAPEYTTNLDAELMNGTVFKDTICSIKDPISVDIAVNGILVWITRIFITTVENISNVDGWLEWLCDNVSSDRLNSVSLDGEAVSSTVCHDSTAGSR